MRVLLCFGSVSLLASGLVVASCGGDSSDSGGTPDASTTDAPIGDDGPPLDASPDASSSSPDYVGGTRLRPIVHTAGATKLFQRWSDTKLGTDCYPGIASDGTTRCLPSSVSGEFVYTDDTCKTPLVGLLASCLPATTPKYALYTDPTAVCVGPDVVEVGPVVTPTGSWTKTQAGDCNPYTGVALELHSVTRTLAPTELVGFTKSNEARGSQLFQTYMNGEDGSRQAFEIEDGPPRQGRCYDQRGTDGTLRCYPPNVAYVENYFSEMGCSTVAAFHEGYTLDVCTQGPLAVAANDPTGCTFAYTYFTNAGRIPGTIYQGSPGSCSVYTPPAAVGASFWNQGPAIPDSAFATLKHVQTATTPLGLDQLAVATGEIVQTNAFWDPVHGFACREAFSLDGKRRCMPNQGGTAYFADAMCKQPLAGVQHKAGCASAAEPVPTHVLVLSPGTCTTPGGTQVFKVGAQVTPAMIYTAPSCVGQAPPADTDFYATTAEIPASELVELTETTE